MSLFPNFTEFSIEVDDNVVIYGIRSGSGPPLLLLHGFPQTHHLWYKVAPKLAEHFTVVALDLRGYGRSSKPPGTPGKHTEYAKSTMARDCERVMTALGFTADFYVCGHDRGGRVAHKLCVDFPKRVRKFMVLDIAPTKAMFEATDKSFATTFFHWFFLIQPSPFPEEAILAATQVFYEWFFIGKSGLGAARETFGEECLEVYRRVLGDRETVHGMCEEYRAAATVDIEEASKDEEDGRKVQCDLRVLWGMKGFVAATFQPLKEWQKVCSGTVSEEGIDSGHYIPNEKPEDVLRNIMEFFE